MLTTTATNLPRLMNCNGSRLMPPSFPVTFDDTTDRDEGNAAHAMGQLAYLGQPLDDLIGTKAYNGVTMTGEMADHVSYYLSQLRPGAMELETSFGTDDYRVSARADHIAYDAIANDLYVTDFKYGHRLVDVEWNWTLVAHAIGYCIFHSVAPTRIIFQIVQPRAYHPDGHSRSWIITYDVLLQLHASIHATLTNPSDTLQTGLSWCATCPALATCPAARSANMNAIDAMTVAFSDDLPDDLLGFELDMLSNAQGIIDARLDALKELVSHRLRTGKVIEGYALEPQLANTRWIKGITGKALTAASRIDCTKDGIITPAEFKRRGGSESVYKALTERPTTGVKLVRSSADKRARRLLGK